MGRSLICPTESASLCLSRHLYRGRSQKWTFCRSRKLSLVTFLLPFLNHQQWIWPLLGQMGLRVPVRVGVILGGLLLPLAFLSTSRLIFSEGLSLQVVISLVDLCLNDRNRKGTGTVWLICCLYQYLRRSLTSALFILDGSLCGSKPNGRCRSSMNCCWGMLWLPKGTAAFGYPESSSIEGQSESSVECCQNSL